MEQLLTEFGLTQADLARHCGITRASVTKWMSGQARPSAETLMKLQNRLGVSYEWILTGKGQMMTRPGSTLEERAFMEIFRSLSPQAQAEVQRLATFLATTTQK